MVSLIDITRSQIEPDSIDPSQKFIDDVVSPRILKAFSKEVQLGVAMDLGFQVLTFRDGSQVYARANGVWVPVVGEFAYSNEKKPNVLYVGEDNTNMLVMTKFFENSPYSNSFTLTTVTDYEDALSILERKKYGAAVVEVGYVGSDIPARGLATKALEIQPTLHMVLLDGSGYNSRGDIWDNLKNAGFSDFLVSAAGDRFSLYHILRSRIVPPINIPQ